MFTLLFSTLFIPTIKATNTAPKELTNVFTKVAILDGNNFELKQPISMIQGRSNKMNIRFDLSDYQDVKDGDYFEFTLPSNFTMKPKTDEATEGVTKVKIADVQFTPNTVTGEDGSKVGGGTIRFTLKNLEAFKAASAAQGTSAVSNIKGEAYFDFSALNAEQNSAVTFTNFRYDKDPSIIFNIRPVPQGTTPYAFTENIFKFNGQYNKVYSYRSVFQGITTTSFHSDKLNQNFEFAHVFKMRINHAGKNHGARIKIKDTLSHGGTYAFSQFIPELFKVSVGKYSVGTVDFTKTGDLVAGQDYEIKYNEGYTAFELNIKNPQDKQYELIYASTGPGDGSMIKNTAQMFDANDNVLRVQDEKPLTEAGGEIVSKYTEGISITAELRGVINIYKIDKDTGVKLGNAHFTVTKKDDPNFSAQTLVTDAQGFVKTTTPLNEGTYIITETTAPVGYDINTEPVEVELVRNIDGDVIGKSVIISNERQKRNFKVKKVWNGNPNGKYNVKFQLYQNGQPYLFPMILDKSQSEIDVKVTNINLDTRQPYTYTVKELDINEEPIEAGNMNGFYRVSYDNTGDIGTITNTFVPPTINFTVNKRWNGGTERRDIKVQLFKNGQPDGDPQTITSNETSYVFQNLPQLDNNGEPYAYVAKELNEGHLPMEIGAVDRDYKVYYENFDTSTNIVNTHLITYTVNKKWIGGQIEGRPIIYAQLYQNGSPYGDKARLTNNTHSWQVPENALDGTPYRYYAKEVNSNGEVIEGTTLLDSYKATYNNTDPKVTEITNTYESPKITFRATKEWVNGPETKPSITLVLYQNGKPYTKPDNTQYKIVLNNGQTQAEFTDIPERNMNQELYTYSVKEEAVDSYIATYPSADRVVNTYESPKVNFVAEKRWVNGPSDKPVIKLELFRNGQKVTGSEATLTAPATTYTWRDLPTTNNAGEAYAYTAREVDDTGSTIATNHKNGNYKVTYEDLVSEHKTMITNTYESPTITFTATKKWVNGPETKPTIKLRLFQNEQPLGETKTMNHGDALNLTWENLPETNEQGVKYTYVVKEVNDAGDAVEAGNKVGDYTVTYSNTDKATVVTNTYESPTKTFTVEKKWKDGPATKPTVKFVLLQNGQKFQDTKTLTNGDTTLTWNNLPVNNDDGVAYTYNVRELSAEDREVFNNVKNGNYVVTYEDQENKTVVTNTYVSPKTTFTATKVWVNGPATKPEVTFKLLRDGVDQNSNKTLANGVTSVTWDNLDETDLTGKAYVYTVEEETVENYTTTYNEAKNKVTNTYTSPKITISALKVWNLGPVTKPSVTFKLFRNGVDTDMNKTLEFSENNNSVSWEVDEKDSEGNNYLYEVKEVAVKNYISTFVKNENEFSFTNTYVSPKITFTATKVWVNGPEEKPTVTFKLLRDGVDQNNNQTLANGVTSVTWNDLDETDENGKAYVYTVEEEAVENYTTTYNEAKNEVTNTYVSPKTAFTATKVWVNGPKEKPTVTFKLLRDGVDQNNNQILANGVTSVTWNDLDETDENGKAYVYTVEEEAVENYTTTYNEAKNEVTNTYVSPKTAFTATKVWVNGPKEKPTVTFKLLRDGVDQNNNQTLANGVTSVTWNDLDETDENGKAYVYTVEEEAVENYTTTYNEAKNEVTNTYVSPKTTFTATKVWVNGPEEKPTVTFKLLRDGVDQNNNQTLANGVTSVTWNDLDLTDENGKAYVYTVEEEAVENYTTTYNEAKNEVTNTYVVKPPVNPILPDTKVPPVKPDVDTADHSSNMMYGLLALIALVLAIGLRKEK